ncbi:porin [Acinetobacter shaoyimingii]|nr:porin [Acinetobacter shaoyimingii]
MNKKLMTIWMMTSLFAVLSHVAYAKPSLYGKFDLSLDYLPQNNATQPDHDKFRLNSNNSLIGIKGEEKLNDRLSAVYQSEWLISIDHDKSPRVLTPRNQFIGLKDQTLGTVKFGKHDSPLKQLGVLVDSYNNSVENNADIQGVMGGDNRVDDSFIYESPAIHAGSGEIDLAVMLPMGSSGGVEKSDGGAKAAGHHLGDAISTSLLYTDSKLSLGLAYDHAMPTNFLRKSYLNTEDTYTDTSGAFAAANTVRAIGRVDLDHGLSLRGLYQNSKVEERLGNARHADDIDEANSWLLGAEYNLPQADKWTLKAQYSATEVSMEHGYTDRDISQFIVGADYALNKKVRIYSYAAYLLLEEGSKQDHQTLMGTSLEFKF